jgi:hypothetical protein
MTRKILLQFKEDHQWKTFCMGHESHKAMVKSLLKALKLAYEDSRIIEYEDYQEATLQTQKVA